MKATLELGRWVFVEPIGYFNAPRSMCQSFMHDPERGRLVDVRSRTTRPAIRSSREARAKDGGPEQRLLEPNHHVGLRARQNADCIVGGVE
jgi:hypothetical protein